MTPYELIQAIQRLNTEAADVIAVLKSALTPVPEIPVVTTASALQDALNHGGEFRVATGEYVGNFTSPTANTTMRCEDNVVLVPGDQTGPTLTVHAPEFHMLRGVIRNGVPASETVRVGSLTETDATRQPQHVLFTGVNVLAGAHGGHRAFSLHGSHIELRMCRADNFWEVGRDSQAVWINNGAGPYLFEDCFLQASGENFLIGGDRLRIATNPSDIVVRRCIMHKPSAWRGTDIQVKNSFEIKSGVRVTLEASIIDGCWTEAQAGTPIVLTPRNQYGDSPHVQVDQVVIRQTKLVNCSDAYGVSILGTDNIYPTEPIRHIELDHCLLPTPMGVLIGGVGGLTLSVQRCTFPLIGRNFLSFYGPAIAMLDYRQNVVKSGAYGIVGDDGQTVGLKALMASTDAYEFSGNLIERSADRTIAYPPDNNLVSPGALASMLDEEYHLQDGSAGW